MESLSLPQAGGKIGVDLFKVGQKVDVAGIFSVLGGGFNYKLVKEQPEVAQYMMDFNHWYNPKSAKAQEMRKAVEATKHANVFHGCKDELMASPYAWAQHGQSGMWVSDLMPHVARRVDDLCFIHSMTAKSNTHGPAENQMGTGYILDGFPSMGSWSVYGLGSESQSLPSYVVMPDPKGALEGGQPIYSNGFLPAVYQPTIFDSSERPVRNLDLCVRKAHLAVKSIVAAPIATGLACLSEEERDLGVARGSGGGAPPLAVLGRRCRHARRRCRSSR